MIIKLKNGVSDYADLTICQPYYVICIEADAFRILNDHGKPYLFPAEIFDVVDLCEPENWVSETGEEGERYACPPVFNEPKFFQRFFDRDIGAVREFWLFINRRLCGVSE